MIYPKLQSYLWSSIFCSIKITLAAYQHRCCRKNSFHFKNNLFKTPFCTNMPPSHILRTEIKLHWHWILRFHRSWSKRKIVTIQWIKSRILDTMDDWYINNLAKNAGHCSRCKSRGLGISVPRGDPRAFDTRVFERWMSLSGRTRTLSKTG